MEQGQVRKRANKKVVEPEQFQMTKEQKRYYKALDKLAEVSRRIDLKDVIEMMSEMLAVMIYGGDVNR